MLTLSHSSNPIIYNNLLYRDKKNWIMFEIKILMWQNEQVSQHFTTVWQTIYAYGRCIDETQSKHDCHD